jgi:hypothetical protein
MKRLVKLATLVALFLPLFVSAQTNPLIGGEPTAYFFDSSIRFDEQIPSPEQFFSYRTGSKITPHYRILDYFKNLAAHSTRTKLIEIGHTHEGRPLTLLAISSPENLAQLDNFRQERQRARQAETPQTPLILFLGYSVHGNEPSGAEASLLTAYYLTAAQTELVNQQLATGIYFIDPVRNPDGQERFAAWVEQNRSLRFINNHPLDREHTEGWPRGRGNHYGFDLNRDWVNIEHPESQARVAFYQDWLPHVQVDHHEMGANSSFFFEPTDPNGNESRFVPPTTYRLNALFADYYARALDRIGSFYYTKEGYDNKNPTFGSTYPDYNGGVGILFEQASSRGIQQLSDNGLLTFAHTIRNQLVTSIATIEASQANKQSLFDLQKEFFSVSSKNNVKNYIIGDAYDPSRLYRFINRLLDHRLEVYENNADLRIDSIVYERGKSYIIPVAQANNALVQIIFDEKKDYPDAGKLGYGAGFSVAYSSGLAYTSIAHPSRGARVVEKLKIHVAPFTRSDYAYLIDFRDSRTQAALFRLLEKDLIVKVASQPFTIRQSEQNVDFPAGTLLIPVAGQPFSNDALSTLLQSISETETIDILPITTGYNIQGVDLGSSAFRRIHKPRILTLTGADISSTEAGEIWHLFDRKLAHPITRIDVESFSRIPLYDFNRIVLAGGAYASLNTLSIEKLKQWTDNGGILITLNQASPWAIRNFFENRTGRRVDSLSPPPSTNTRRRLPTSIFETRIQLQHPLAYGLTRSSLPIIKENLFVLPSASSGIVATYPDSPLLNGYLPEESKAVFKNAASIQSANNLILFAEDPLFRGVWDATERTFVNAILFGDLVRPVFW